MNFWRPFSLDQGLSSCWPSGVCSEFCWVLWVHVSTCSVAIVTNHGCVFGFLVTCFSAEV